MLDNLLCFMFQKHENPEIPCSNSSMSQRGNRNLLGSFILAHLYEDLTEVIHASRKTGEVCIMKGLFWFVQIWFTSMFWAYMLSSVPSDFPRHVAGYDLTTCTNKVVSSQTFLEYLSFFFFMKQFKTHFSPFSLRHTSPSWYRASFSSTLEPSTAAIWQKLIKPYYVVYYLKHNKVKVFVVHPQFFSC